MEKILTLDPEKISGPELHKHLVAAVAPRPICFASTVDEAGKVNLSPYSFFNVFSSSPPIMVFAPVRRRRDEGTKDTYENIKAIKEVVINIVTYPMVEQTSLASTEYERGVNEFVKAGFTEVASEKVRPPRVGESPVAFECMVDQVIDLGESGGAGSLVICRVVLVHLQTEYLKASGTLDTEKLDLVARMGEDYYCRAHGEAIFEIPKPSRNLGMGLDQLPQSIRESAILTGNDLGRLGSIHEMPNSAALQGIAQEEAVEKLWDTFGSQPGLLENRVHTLAKQWIALGDAEKALALLVYWDREIRA